MTGARVTVDDSDIRAAIRGAIIGGANERALLDDIGGYLVASTQRRIETKRGPDGSAWQPFSPKTLKRLPRRRLPPQLLRDSNRLYGSMTSVVDGAELLVGTNVLYAGIHQFGGTIDQAERTQTATFKTVNAGAGRKIVDGELVTYGSRLRFARASDRAKRKEQKTFTVPARTIAIPARPSLGISTVDRIEIAAIVEDHLRRATGAT